MEVWVGLHAGVAWVVVASSRCVLNAASRGSGFAAGGALDCERSRQTGAEELVPLGRQGVRATKKFPGFTCVRVACIQRSAAGAPAARATTRIL